VLYRCYAKINLTLEVLSRRQDGFHDLASLVHTIDLADDLRIDSADTLLMRVEGLDIEPETNLVARAARLLATATGVTAGAQLTLLKRIPAAAGLGGGSSDAATTLVGLNRLWATRLGIARLGELAARLGSDIPFFVRGGAALMQGRGDELQALPPIRGQWLILVVPAHDVGDKTRRLYTELNIADFSSGDATARAAERLARQLALRDEDLINAFERAARSVFPELSQTWAEVERVAGRRFFLSGAGPALFGFAQGRDDALRLVPKLKQLGLPTFATRTVRHGRASIKQFAVDPPIGYP
jgi:4-diphosphocytidyl-2-C-methyl-D-erythritol kinase